MNLRCASLGLLLVFGAGAAGAKTAAMPSTREDLGFRVCVIDESRTPEAADRVALRSRVIACFRDALAQTPREWREQTVTIKVAAKRLKVGECEAAIVLGPNRPRKLRRLDVVTFGINLGAVHGFEPVYLIVPARAEQWQKNVLARYREAFSPLQPTTELWAAR